MLSAKQVEPGKSGEIAVEVKTEGVTALSKSVTVSTNDPKQPTVILTITAVVQPEIICDKSIYFGSAPKGKEVVKEILITLPQDKPVRLLSATSTDQNVSVRLEPVPNSNGKKMKLVAVQKADAKDGYHFGIILIKTTSQLTPELKISERGMVTPGQSN